MPKRLVENDVKTLPAGFLEYPQAMMSSYRGISGEIAETEEHATAEEYAARVH